MAARLASLVAVVALAAAVGAGSAAASHGETSKTVERLNAYLTGTPMEGIGEVLDHQGRRHNVSPYFIVAVAAKESSHGIKACYRNPKNVWGLGACDRHWKVPYFRTWTQAVNYFVRFVNRLWPSATTPWSFRGYCKGCESSWAEDVAWFMGRMGVTSSIRYG